MYVNYYSQPVTNYITTTKIIFFNTFCITNKKAEEKIHFTFYLENTFLHIALFSFVRQYICAIQEDEIFTRALEVKRKKDSTVNQIVDYVDVQRKPYNILLQHVLD